jgi:RIO-like serine/threonine protein kinase
MEHGDTSLRNLLITGDGRPVWIDFDRSQVYDHVHEPQMASFRERLRAVYRILFEYIISRTQFAV